MTDTHALLKISGLSKRFGGTSALESVSLDLRAGEVIALCGENGAGKSTLMKILSGALTADEGEIFLAGEIFKPQNPLDARGLGIGMIHQELTLAPDLTVEANISLGIEPARWGWISRDESRARALRTLKDLGHPKMNLDRTVASLSNAEKQIIEIARNMVNEPRVLILDEPTSSLSAKDAELLLALVKKLAARGVGLIYISHFLEECQRVASRYAVLRDGRLVGSGAMSEITLPGLVTKMVGRDLNELYPKRAHAIGETVFEVKDLRNDVLRGVDWQLRRGEILGVAGLLGSGRTEAVRACFGLDALDSGGVTVKGTTSAQPTPRKNLNRGVGLLSENRKEEGLMVEQSVTHNLTLSHLGRLSRAGWVNASLERKETTQWIESLKIKTAGPDQCVAELSGGNQQKIALARLLSHPCEVLLLDEPTRGIDVLSKAQIYGCLQDLAHAGKAILFVSSYLPELLGVCDTIAVMRQGKIVSVRAASEWTEAALLEAALPLENENENVA